MEELRASTRRRKSVDPDILVEQKQIHNRFEPFHEKRVSTDRHRGLSNQRPHTEAMQSSMFSQKHEKRNKIQSRRTRDSKLTNSDINDRKTNKFQLK